MWSWFRRETIVFMSSSCSRFLSNTSFYEALCLLFVSWGLLQVLHRNSFFIPFVTILQEKDKNTTCVWFFSLNLTLVRKASQQQKRAEKCSENDWGSFGQNGNKNWIFRWMDFRYRTVRSCYCNCTNKIQTNLSENWFACEFCLKEAMNKTIASGHQIFPHLFQT